MQIKVKPLSVNEVWSGRRFKTPRYKSYEQELFYLLPKEITIPEGNLLVKVIWGLSNSAADIDNPTKPFLDILQKKYNFNDKRITCLILQKMKVKKGKEFIDFYIRED